mgnify:CR=1 FL=1
MLHEIRVNGYAAEADGPLDLGTWGSYGTEQLHFAFDSAWDDLTKSVTFSTDGYTGEAVTLLLPESGLVEVPQQATAAHTVCGHITVLGTCAGMQRISADLPYQTRNHSAVPGQAPQSLPSAFEEISTAAERASSRAQSAEDAAALAQTSAQVARAAAQDAVRVAASAFQGEKLTYADLTEQDKADLRRPALEAAATANEAVAGLGQTLLRYGVQVGQIGEIVLFADGTLHPNHLWADGSEIDPAAYPELAAFAAQTGWAKNSATGRYRLPDLRQRFPLMNSTNVGATGGEASHTLTVAELPSHSHTYTPRVDWSDNAGWGISSSFSNGNNLSVDKSITNRTAAIGSGQAHNNMPPYYTAAAQIRARRDVLLLELLGSE